MKKLTIAFLFVVLLIALVLASRDTPAQDPSGGEASEKPLETFVPSEKLPADSAISFPVDI